MDAKLRCGTKGHDYGYGHAATYGHAAQPNRE